MTGTFLSDDFNGALLDNVWSFAGVAGSLGLGSSGDEAFLILSAPAGVDTDPFDENLAVRALQAIDDEDFQLEARFLTEPSQRFQLQGLMVEQDANNWIRFDVYFNGQDLNIYAGVTTNGDTATQINLAIPPGSAEHIRVTRTGDQ
ncbi:MAG: hypothetical protein AAFR68_19295, partial [Pseudomonadota bacterium]